MRDAGSLDGSAALTTVTDAAVAMHRAFHAERRFIELTMAVSMDLEGLGPVQTHFVDLEDLAPPARLAEPSWPQRIGGTFAVVGRGIPHIVRRRRAAVA